LDKKYSDLEGKSALLSGEIDRMTTIIKIRNKTIEDLKLKNGKLEL
jgi:hypothetical protein